MISRDDNTELLIDLIQGALEEEGHKTKRFSDSDKHRTTSYDAIEVKGYDGNYYTIIIDKRSDYEDFRDGQKHYADEVYRSI